MNLKQLRYATALASFGHFGRAADACNVTQPTLSLGIKKLEEELGVILFERLRGDVQVTDIGRKVLERAQRILDEAVSISEIVLQSADPLAITLRLGVIRTVGPYLLPFLIPSLRKAAPQMALLIEEDYTTELIAQLRHGDLDAVIVGQPIEESDLQTAPLYDEPFVVAVPAAHPWANRRCVEPEELLSEDLLILRKGHCFRDQVLGSLALDDSGESRSGIQKTLESSSLETIRHMVIGGTGITVLPSLAASADLTGRGLVRYLPFSDPPPSRRISLVWRASFPRQAAIDALIDQVTRISLRRLRPLESAVIDAA